MSASRLPSPVPAPDTRGSVVVKPAGRTRGMHKVKFGDVTIWAPKPSEAQVRANAAAGTEALRRGLERLIRPGIKMRERKNIPYYHVDPDNSGVFVRRLNGVAERGILEDGEFKVIG
jgi:hypothetical protein